MIRNAYSIFDSKLATFSQPFFDLTDASAIRNFSDAIADGSNPNNQWHKHPEDFSLFVVGSFDDEKGELLAVVPRSLITASATVYKKPVKKNGQVPPELEIV